MKRLIKNYTTDVPAERTVTEIQELLRHNGARGIALEYDDAGNLKDVYFKVLVNSRELPFRLPAKADRVFQAMWGDRQPWEI